MIKQRIASLGLGLALLGSFVGFAGTANAATSGDIVVEASTTDILTISVSPSAINFGSGLDFLGNGASSEVQQVCGLPNGAQFVGPNVTVEVTSSQDYEVDRAVQDLGSTPSPLQMANNTYVNPGAYDFSCSFSYAQSVATLMSGDTRFEDAGSAGKQIVGQEHYILNVLAGEDPGTYKVQVTYSATQV